MPFYREAVPDTVPYAVSLAGTEMTIPDTSDVGMKTAEMTLAKLMEFDRTAVDLDPVLFANEMAALRLEVFAIAWYHKFKDDKHLIGQALLMNDYLSSRNSRQDIWAAMKDYNNAAARSTEKSLPEGESAKRGQVAFRNTFKLEVFKKWDKAGVPGEVAAHALNLFFTEFSWTTSNQWTPIFLAYALTRRIGKTTPDGSPAINDEGRAHILGTIHGMYRDVNEHLNAFDIKA